MRYTQKVLLIAIALAPVAAYGRSAVGAPTQRAGVPADGGLVCTACHTTTGPSNSDPRGHLTIQAAPYTPGVKQTIRVTLTHPTAQRWGFELTARPMSDQSKMAGSFGTSSDVQVKCGPPVPPTFGTAEACAEAGALQFATHTAASTKPGTSGGNTWEIEWTPPATDVGEVALFAAGNAANNNGNNQGDYIFNTQIRIEPAAGCSLTTNPTVGGIVNGASFSASQPIGFGSMISIFGSGFTNGGVIRSADRFDFTGDDSGHQFPHELACVKVEVNDQEVPVVFVSPNQINAQAPTQVLNGPAKVEVRINKGLPNERKAEFTVQFSEFSPGFFAAANTKHIASQHADFKPVGAAGAYNNPDTSPAKPGEVIILYGTGFGVTSPVWQAGEIPTDDRKGRIANPFTVTVGGTTLSSDDIQYAGHSPGSISGLYQLNIRIPANAPDGDLPVVMRVGGAATDDKMFVTVHR